MKGEKMSYGQVAIDAVIEFQNQQHQNLLQAWYQALKLNNVSDKVCPRIAFLGLCESGYIVGVPQGNYIQKSTPSVIKQKAVGIRNIIMNTNPPALPTQSKTTVWTQVGGTGQHEGVIDVVYALFNSGVLQ
jgi:hypothetical protein